jgi:hypothetical protein
MPYRVTRRGVWASPFLSFARVLGVGKAEFPRAALDYYAAYNSVPLNPPRWRAGLAVSGRSLWVTVRSYSLMTAGRIGLDRQGPLQERLRVPRGRDHSVLWQTERSLCRQRFIHSLLIIVDCSLFGDVRRFVHRKLLNHCYKIRYIDYSVRLSNAFLSIPSYRRRAMAGFKTAN